MDKFHDDVEAIRQLLGDLTRRVYRIERTLGLQDPPSSSAEPARAVELVSATPGQPVPAGRPAVPPIPPRQQPEPNRPYIPPTPRPPASTRPAADLASRIGSH